MSILIKDQFELQKLKRKYLEQTLVATNGCFDILHVGHIRYLKEAKSFGDILIVGINSDLSVKSLKGKKRPINTEVARAEILNSLRFVDYSYIFLEKTAENFLEILRPDFYVKAGDYSLANLPEKNLLEKFGIKIKFAKFHQGYSSSGLLEKSSQSN